MFPRGTFSLNAHLPKVWICVNLTSDLHRNASIRAPKPGRTSHNMSCYNSKLQGTPRAVIWCDVEHMQLIWGADILCIPSRAHTADPYRQYCACLLDVFMILRCWPQESKRWAALHLHAAPPCSRGLDSRPRFLLHTSLIEVI